MPAMANAVLPCFTFKDSVAFAATSSNLQQLKVVIIKFFITSFTSVTKPFKWQEGSGFVK